jgi:hypothetical protein
VAEGLTYQTWSYCSWWGTIPVGPRSAGMALADGLCELGGGGHFGSKPP